MIVAVCGFDWSVVEAKFAWLWIVLIVCGWFKIVLGGFSKGQNKGQNKFDCLALCIAGK